MAVLVQFLRWSDLDPATHLFDVSLVRSAVERCVFAGGLPNLEEAIDRALLTKYGAWAAGWRWAASEPGGGGPVRGWCCARDSLLRKDDPGPEASVDRVLAALQDWRAFIEQVAAIFAELREEDAKLPDEQKVEHAAARLLPPIPSARTGCRSRSTRAGSPPRAASR